jgi:hypothetical protein
MHLGPLFFATGEPAALLAEAAVRMAIGDR